MSQPLAIDLFCGLGGWTEGLLAEGYRVVGFDVERHVYGDERYPAQLVLQDVLTIHGRQFASADLIVASPPCQEYSYMAMPWSRSKQIAAEYRSGVRDVRALTALFNACFRIQREACEAAGRHIPMVVENVRGAQPWVGRARWHYGSFYLWGDVPALMPMTRMRSKATKPGADRQLCVIRQDQIRHISEAHRSKSPKKGYGGVTDDGIKHGGDCFQDGAARSGSKSPARKAASAKIAKIPLPLSRWIARAWRPK